MGRTPTAGPRHTVTGSVSTHDIDSIKLMAGTWVTSFSGVVHDEPEDGAPTPRIPAYKHVDSNPQHAATGGYFFAATLLCLKFDGSGSFTGTAQIIRGGEPAPQNKVFGTYTVRADTQLGVIVGRIFAIYPLQVPVHTTYDFVAITQDELKWLRTSSESDGKPASDRSRHVKASDDSSIKSRLRQTLPTVERSLPAK